MLVGSLRLGAEVMSATMGLDAELQFRDCEVDPSHEAPLGITDLVLRRQRWDPRVIEASRKQFLEPTFGHRSFVRYRIEQAQQPCCAALARAMQPLGCQADPVDRASLAASIGQSLCDPVTLHHRSEVGQGSCDPGRPDTEDVDDVTRIERGHVMGDDPVLELAAMTPVEADFDQTGVRRAVQSVEARRRSMRRNGMCTACERCGEEAGPERRRTAGESEHSGVRLGDPPLADRCCDSLIGQMGGGLGTGDDAVRIGRKLRNSCNGAVGHASDRTDRSE